MPSIFPSNLRIKKWLQKMPIIWTTIQNVMPQKIIYNNHLHLYSFTWWLVEASPWCVWGWSYPGDPSARPTVRFSTLQQLRPPHSSTEQHPILFPLVPCNWNSNKPSRCLIGSENFQTMSDIVSKYRPHFSSQMPLFLHLSRLSLYNFRLSTWDSLSLATLKLTHICTCQVFIKSQYPLTSSNI